MQRHLDWLRDHRSAKGTPEWHADVAREIGVTEAMETLQRHGARLVEQDRS